SHILAESLCMFYSLLRAIIMICTIVFHVYFSTFFFFNDTATTEIYTLSLHDALPISRFSMKFSRAPAITSYFAALVVDDFLRHRSEEHTSELQSRGHLVCRLLLEKKKKKIETLS